MMRVTTWEINDGVKSSNVWSSLSAHAQCAEKYIIQDDGYIQLAIPTPGYIDISVDDKYIGSYQINPPTISMEPQKHINGAVLINCDPNYKIPLTDEWRALPDRGRIERNGVVFIMQKIKPMQHNCNLQTGRRYVYRLQKVIVAGAEKLEVATPTTLANVLMHIDDVDAVVYKFQRYVDNNNNKYKRDFERFGFSVAGTTADSICKMVADAACIVNIRRRSCTARYKVHQLNMSDADDDDQKKYKSSTVVGGNIGDWSQYRHVANVTANAMEDVFEKMNQYDDDTERIRSCRKLSVGDIVEYDGRFHLVAVNGFKDITDSLISRT
jgi:hypothetical protein